MIARSFATKFSNEWGGCIMNDKELSDAIHELGVLLGDPLTGLMVTTMKQDFWEKYKGFELHRAWECFVDEINRVNTVIELHDELVARQWVGDLYE